MATPVRLQRSRAKDSRLVSPNGLPVKYVGQPTKWGNPVLVRHDLNVNSWDVVDYDGFLLDVFSSQAHAIFCAVARHRALLIQGSLRVSVEDVRRELRRCNLSCWCALPNPGVEDLCHAVTYLEVANG